MPELILAAAVVGLCIIVWVVFDAFRGSSNTPRETKFSKDEALRDRVHDRALDRRFRHLRSKRPIRR